MNIYSWFSAPHKWKKGRGCLLSNGNNLPLNEMDVNDNKTYKLLRALSLHDAICLFTSCDIRNINLSEASERDKKRLESTGLVSQEREKMAFKIKRAISAHTGKDMGIAEFNDHEDTNFEDIKRVIEMSKNERR